MTMTQSTTGAEAAIRALIEERIAAVRTKDVERAARYIAPDVVVFDVVNALQSMGAEAARHRTEAWFGSFSGSIEYEVRELSISVGGDIAFSHCLNRYSGTQTGGVEIDMWVRATTCYRQIEGNWMITHEHQSVPFDGTSGQASLDLTP